MHSRTPSGFKKASCQRKNIYSSMVPNVCPGTEYKRGRTFLSEGELFPFRDRREEGHCLPSEARLDSPSERRSRKGKSSPEERKASEFVISVPRTHNWHHRGTHFLSLWRLFNHKSNYIQIPLAWMLFMDGPHFIYRCPLL